MWPNPNRGDQLYLTIDQLNADVTTATVDIFDLYGKKVTSRTIAINGSTLNTVINLDGTIASGMYLVNLTAGEQTFVQRLVIQ
ncbi:MAG: T9SS type A sorting domain-containing protein [Flavobacteriales bacterium]|nr:T9SS type A sorting domain-containing protein [Flavobacteriales bacterium]